jgi:transmembrane sensor
MQINKPDITDLLSDESFIRYCKKSSPADIIFWEDYLLKNPDQLELIEAAKDRFLVLFNTIAEADLREQEDRLRNRLSGIAPVISIDESSGTGAGKRRMFWIRLTAVACILIIICIFSISHFSSKKEKAFKTFLTNYGERKNIQLPDGSVVNLNAGSKIVINESFDQLARDVYLTGEAFFDVKHNEKKPFIVHTADMDVKALGTAFDIKAYNEERLTQTSLIRGIVEVTLKKNNNKVLLYPSQKIIWENNSGDSPDAGSPSKKAAPNNPAKISPQKIKVTEQGDIKEIAWKDNKLVFDNDTMDEIAHMIERWYGVHILFRNEEIRSYRFTGVFEREDLRTVLTYLKESRQFNFKIDNGENLTVYLSI